MKTLRLTLSILAAAVLASPGAAVAQSPAPRSPAMSQQPAPATMQSLAPVLIVDAVEPCIAFWVDRLGFTKENEVPGPGGRLVFASVRKDGVEIMYQTRESVVAENAAMAAELNGHSIGLFITVGSVAELDAAERAVQGAPVVKPRHHTFYGTTEFYVREPGGNVVGFSAHD